MMLPKVFFLVCAFSLWSSANQCVSQKIKTTLSKGALFLGVSGAGTAVSRKACERAWVPTENVWEKATPKLVSKCLRKQWCVPNYTQAKTWLDKLTILSALYEKCPVTVLEDYAEEFCFSAYKQGALAHERVNQFCRNLPLSHILFYGTKEQKNNVVKLESALQQEPYRHVKHTVSAVKGCNKEQTKQLKKFFELAKKLEAPLTTLLMSTHKMSRGLKKFETFAENHSEQHKPGEHSLPSVAMSSTQMAAETALRNGMLQASKNLDIIYEDIDDVVKSLAPQLNNARETQVKLDPDVVRATQAPQSYQPDGSTCLETLWHKGLWHIEKNAKNTFFVTEEKAVAHLNSLDINANTQLNIVANNAVVRPQILLLRVHGNVRIRAPFDTSCASPHQLQYHKSPFSVENPVKTGGGTEPLIVIISADSFNIDYNPASVGDVRIVFTKVPLENIDNLSSDVMGLTTKNEAERKIYQDFYNKCVAPHTLDTNPCCLAAYNTTPRALADLFGVPELMIQESTHL